MKIAITGVFILAVVLGYSAFSAYKRTRQTAAAKELYMNGLRQYNLGSYTEAVALHKRAIDIYPFYSEAYIQIALCYKALGQYPEAIEAYKHITRMAPDEALPYMGLFDIYRQLGDYAKAIEISKK